MDNVKTGKYIREQRIKNSLTQKELAERLDVEPQTVSKWERGMGVPDTSLLVPLAKIFNVTVEDILEPREVPEADLPAAPQDEPDVISELPVTVLPEGSAKTERRLSFSDFFSVKKLKESVRAFFGENYEWKVNRKLLFGGVFKRHKRSEFDRAATQGLFRDEPAHKNGIASPFLFFYVFLVCISCYSLSIRVDPAVGMIFASAMTVVPLLVFAYELEFPRTVSLLRAIFILLIGGMCSIIAALAIYFFGWFLPDVALTILAGPVEEFAKAALVIAIVILLKPRYLLSGLLIGFCVGAGFTLFESIKYCSGSYIQTILEGLAGEEADIAAAYDEAGSAAVWTGVIRSVTDLFIGHHFWAGIYGGALVLCKKDETLSGKHIFDKNVLTVFFLCVALHTAFDTILLIDAFWSIFLALAVAGSGTLLLFNRMLNVGLSQYEVSEEYRRFMEDREAEREVPPDEPEDAEETAEAPVSPDEPAEDPVSV